MSVKECYFKFTQLAKFERSLFPDSRGYMSKFVIGMSNFLVKEYKLTMLIADMDVTHLMNHA